MVHSREHYQQNTTEKFQLTAAVVSGFDEKRSAIWRLKPAPYTVCSTRTSAMEDYIIFHLHHILQGDQTAGTWSSQGSQDMQYCCTQAPREDKEPRASCSPGKASKSWRWSTIPSNGGWHHCHSESQCQQLNTVLKVNRLARICFYCETAILWPGRSSLTIDVT